MRHPYHILSPSPLPFFLATNLLYLLISIIGYLTGIKLGLNIIIINILMVLYILYLWLYDIIIESYYLGFHTNIVSRSLIIGFLLFLITEVMLFFSLFWAYFHSALNPYYLIWPPIGIDLINPWSIPLLNTFLLLYSGSVATWAHHSSIRYDRTYSLFAIFLTIILGILFFMFQIFEYTYSTFNITDSVYGSTFFIITGLHALHIIIGLLFFTFLFIRIYKFHFPTLLFDITLLYWHLVDLVWIILFILIYYMAY
jgi:cytochrome c oxidase subunit 3